MKTRLISLSYRGSASVDPRYSAAMLPWTINDIRSTDSYTKLSVGIECGVLESYNSDFELQFSHPLKHIVGMCRVVPPSSGGGGRGGAHKHIVAALTSSASFGSLSLSDRSSFASDDFITPVPATTTAAASSAATTTANGHASHTGGATSNGNGSSNGFMEFTGPFTGLVYLIKNPRDPLLHIYLFECESTDEMAELMHQMRDQAQTLGGSVGSIPKTLVATSGSGGELSMPRALAGKGVHTTPATNLKLTEATRNAQHDTSPNLVSSKMKSSKSYTHGLSNSAGTVHIPTSTSAQGNLSLLADISPNHTHFFEVMYVGKIRVSHKRVPFSFIDDALPKFKAYDAQRSRLQMQMSTNRKMSLNSEAGVSSFEGMKGSSFKEDDVEEEDEEQEAALQQREDEERLKALGKASADAEEQAAAAAATAGREEEKENKSPKKLLLRGMSQLEISVKKEPAAGKSDASASEQNEDGVATAPAQAEPETEGEAPPTPNVIINKHPSPPPPSQAQVQEQAPGSQHQLNPLDNIPKQRDRSASYGCIPPYVEQNRTMVFLIGRSDLRLISPDRKQVLLYKDFKDVASCAQGQKNGDHFGIICREAHNDGYIGYVFKCQSDHVCDDIVAAISQAFVTCAEQKKKEANQIFSCEHCPMLWYHKLCTDVEGLSEKKTQAMIFRHIESLSDDEQDTIWAKFYGSEKMNSPLSEQNQFLMMLLRAHCESRQQRHVHDTAENRSEFLNQYLGGSTIFMKAKRSLTNSFDHLLKRKASKDDIGVPSNTLGVRDLLQGREGSAEPPAVAGPAGSKSGNETPPEGFRSRSNTLGSSSPSKPSAEQLKSPMMDIFIKVGNIPKEADTHQGSWRQAILNSVVTPSKGLENNAQAEFLSPMRITQPKRGKRTPEELRDLWKTAIRQTILLNRMETENAMLQARQNENELKRIKLDYEEIVPCDKQLIDRWEMIIERDSVKIGNKKDPKVLVQAIKNGVPRSKRGDVWTFLAEQHSMNTAPVDAKRFPNFNTPYHTLLKNLTEHQHAIFVDLGRTFPNHKFYKDPLGLGQLSLFNLLKAYSILDPELGYCQGLGFICGILLLHCDEADAFQLLKHLMFRRQMRTKYLPDMKNFQLELYQLSRLVKDHLPDLYEWLDQNDVSPTLYAAPWILTVFSSQFPLGFVARVFDLLFMESSKVIFKFAIALLTVHKDELLARDNFEEIMDYLKAVVPKIDAKTMEKVMKLVFTMDINQQLTEYNVEYNVLQEEVSTTNHHLEMLNREKSQSSHLEQQLQFAQSSIAQLEKTRTSQQSQITALQSQVQSLELTIQTLGRFVAHVVERNVDLELPGEVRRILQQLNDLERQRRKPLFTERKIGKSVSVNSHLGFPLKVLEELNERDEHGSPQKQKKEKTPFFENTYEQLRQQRSQGSFSGGSSAQPPPPQAIPTTAAATSSASAPTSSFNTQLQPPAQPLQRPNRLLDMSSASIDFQAKLNELKLPEHVDKFVASIKSPLEVDSGVGTPLSPPSTSSNISNMSSSSTSSADSPAGGSLFSRMGYKNTPTSLSPMANSRTIYAAAPAPVPVPTESRTKTETTKKSDLKVVESVQVKAEEMHPLSMVGDVNVRFNGTTQLKSKRPIYHMRPLALTTTNAPSGESKPEASSASTSNRS